MTDLKVEMARSFRRDGLSFRQTGTALGMSRTTVSRYLAQQYRFSSLDVVQLNSPALLSN